MSVIKLSPVVAAIADVITLFDRIMVYRSTAGQSGPFAPITTYSSAIPLVAGQITYAFEDLQGAENYYYCVQYINTQTGAVSGFSTPQLGSGSAAETICSVATLKTNYLFGVDLTDPNGAPMPDSLFSYYLASAVSLIEKMLDIPLVNKAVRNERHDYTHLQSQSHNWIQLDNHIVQHIEALRIQYPGQPTGTPIPLDWVHLDQDRGTVQIVPSSAFGGGPGPFYAMGSYGLYQKYIPDFYSVDYTAGFAPGACPPEITEVVGMQAALPVLDICGDLLGGAGVASSSISIDGLSQSVNTTSSAENSGYGARVKLYNEALAQKIPILRSFYRGMPLAVA